MKITKVREKGRVREREKAKKLKRREWTIPKIDQDEKWVREKLFYRKKKKATGEGRSMDKKIQAKGEDLRNSRRRAQLIGRSRVWIENGTCDNGVRVLWELICWIVFLYCIHYKRTISRFQKLLYTYIYKYIVESIEFGIWFGLILGWLY